MTHEKIDFYSEVVVKDSSRLEKMRGKKGIIMGISEENGVIYGYSVRLEGVYRSHYLDKNDLIPTGKKFKHEDFYDGSSLGVTPDGEVTRVDIKPE